ncbi:hypothetical protein FB45DRAFT_826290 [Roridomyces roridus]|uniref:LysM domain-containing protein n=1 Tax=Roridomyces roridus TaxID=1738132 RepID=A0AAD7C9A2_9AGAR|nr:hypothetical protein FB45DRAFT_826290 [Roridomyces roridus]
MSAELPLVRIYASRTPSDAPSGALDAYRLSQQERQNLHRCPGSPKGRWWIHRRWDLGCAGRFDAFAVLQLRWGHALANGRYDQQVKSIINNNCAANSSGTNPPPSCSQTYTVVSGDTCAGIEAKTGVSDATLRSLNSEINSACSNLQVGQQLCVSGGSPSSSCTQTYTVVSGDTCAVIESKNGISDATLHSLNPTINSACSNLQVGQQLCVSSSSTSPPSGCSGQTYTVVSGDTCATVESKNGISDATLHSLNPSINSACSNLQVGQQLCVNGGTTTNPPGDCSGQTYTVVSGDTCTSIESKNGISDATLHSLNPSINSACSNLQVGQQLCVSGGTTTCTKSYTVVSGDTCVSVESKNGISDATLHSLNPSINSACSNLQVGQNLCVSGGSGSCAQSYTVASGDTCVAIESRFGISDATLHSLNPSVNSACSNLQVGQQLCV